MKVGHKFPLLFEVVRPAETGEVVFGQTLNNHAGNLFFAKRFGASKDEPEILCCFDGLTEAHEKRMAAITVLMEETGA
jgi:hypothetical protein